MTASARNRYRCWKKHLRKHLVNEKLVLAGRKYGILYSNPSGKKVTFRLFAESGVGIDKCDEISAPEVAKRCIPLDLNPGLSLTKYMKRMKLSFTSTIPTLILEPGMFEQIDDIKAAGTGNEMTDGCGFDLEGGAEQSVHGVHSEPRPTKSRYWNISANGPCWRWFLSLFELPGTDWRFEGNVDRRRQSRWHQSLLQRKSEEVLRASDRANGLASAK